MGEVKTKIDTRVEDLFINSVRLLCGLVDRGVLKGQTRMGLLF